MRSVDPDLTNIEIAKRLGISYGTLANALTLGRKQGWLKFVDPVNQLQHEIIPKATDNIIELLDEKDRTTTLAVFNGIIAPIYRQGAGVSDVNNNVIALKIEMPPADQMPTIKGKIVGEGRAFDKAEDDDA